MYLNFIVLRSSISLHSDFNRIATIQLTFKRKIDSYADGLKICMKYPKLIVITTEFNSIHYWRNTSIRLSFNWLLIFLTFSKHTLGNCVTKTIRVQKNSSKSSWNKTRCKQKIDLSVDFVYDKQFIILMQCIVTIMPCTSVALMLENLNSINKCTRHACMYIDRHAIFTNSSVAVYFALVRNWSLSFSMTVVVDEMHK